MIDLPIGLTFWQAIGFVVSMLSFVIGGSLVLAALFSFNNYFHERRGHHTEAIPNFIDVFAGFKLGFAILIAFYSLIRHWRDNKEGRLLFSIGLLLIVVSIVIGVNMDYPA